jgi:Zinc knuckle
MTTMTACFRCGEPGHVRAGCPDARRDPEPPPQIDIPDIGNCFVCGQPGHFAIACRLHPARLRKIRGEACGPGPCSERCRGGDHNDCSPYWCTCLCHGIEIG